MKKIIIAASLAVALLLLSSCFGGDGTGNDKYVPCVTDPSDIASNDKDETAKTTVEEAEKNGASYTVSYERYFESTEKYRLNILYPVFDDCDNAALISEAVRSHSLSYMQDYITYQNPGEGYFSCSVDDVVLTHAGNKLASFQCKGSCYSEGAAHPNEFTYTINIEIETGKLLGFEDIITKFDALAEIYKNGAFSLISTGNPTLDGELAKLPYEELINQYSSLYKIYPPIYFVYGENGISLVLSLEQVYALGSRADFHADAEDVRSVLTEEISTLLFD